MRFGPVPVGEAAGALLVHSVRQGGLVLKKGTVIGAAEMAALAAAGIVEVVVARLDPDDVTEDTAAAAVATAVAGPLVRVDAAFTGRANLFAEAAGLLVVDRAGIDSVNAVDPDITVATLPAFAPVVEGTMVATAKIIPFAVSGRACAAAVAAAEAAAPLVRVAPYRVRKVAVVSTLLPGLADKVIDKTLRVTAARLAPAGAAVVAERRVPHETAAVTRAVEDVLREGAELAIVFGASAIADRRDVIPAAVEAAGGRIERFGMPVDPGNLLMIAEVDGRPVLGAPGCARSPKENGFDWVLARLMCGLPVTDGDVAGMGVGGLLMEIVTRPQPREMPPAVPAETNAMTPPARRLAAVVLAAGRSTRMGGPNKLLAEIGGRPLVRIAVEAALASRARPVVVVTGHQHEAVAAALAGLPVSLVHNPDHAEGLSTSVRTGIAAVPDDAEGAVVCLGDMPQVGSGLIDRLIAAFDPEKGALIVIPTIAGQRGNPVVWSRRFFPELGRLTGDVGARNLIAAYQEAVAEVAADPAAATDVDTPEALAAVKATLEGG
ncbi:NTP transferase domain-containing protein [Rhodoplanes serenus]|uniref:NTP transferase domain-containing protein n=1 Tax=Rhodoplanes serenus TaxID=200615 RepID=A0A9X4XUH6_9BRAD|nr:molybdopterin-binding/glycosyltransferase family 2 protein [Rhodoplanes serenus]MTW19196.1 NTP transferase domain-containing protein [Rhodoplanes serenus]